MEVKIIVISTLISLIISIVIYKFYTYGLTKKLDIELNKLLTEERNYIGNIMSKLEKIISNKLK